MFFHSRTRNRPFHYGYLPLETLPRDEGIIAEESARPPISVTDLPAPAESLAAAARQYRDLYAGLAVEDSAPEKAPVPDDLERRVIDIKGGGYFMDADQVGVCLLPENAWLVGETPEAHSHAVVFLVEHGQVPEKGNLAREWVSERAIKEAADLRIAEISVCIARHIRKMGFSARAHFAGTTKLDAERLAVLSGVAVRSGEGITNPYIGSEFAIGVVSTDYELEVDTPLRAESIKNAKGLRFWLGLNGARSGREINRRKKRPSHLSRYPMETVKRVDRPTTLIIDDEVPQVPKRAAFFERALQGDLGEKSQRERLRFAFKHPFADALLGMIKPLVPYQDGQITPSVDQSNYSDPEANTKAIKSLSYLLGSDLTGICEIPRYAWYSHKEDGTPIERAHKYAVVMLVDQGHDTMEAASGDDWISGSQSMRGYLRGASIAGVMADHVRSLGYPARSQTNADSQVLQIPLVLLAGLGELSRIGELVLNPFVGPRFKSVVLTTDMPLVPDKPIDFGLQYFCDNCLKCARECPCDAISWGDKVVFNGYEMWKPDTERCTRYRVTNPKGAGCGRCMKTCPINKVVDADGPLFTRMASWCGINARWLKPILVPVGVWLDDKLGNGKRNLKKKWWLDHELVGDIAVEPTKGTNQRDIDPSRVLVPENQKIAYYHADMMPPPDSGKDPVPVNRKEALAAKAKLETPASAAARVAAGGPKPAHYNPTAPLGRNPEDVEGFVNPVVPPKSGPYAVNKGGGNDPAPAQKAAAKD